MANHVDVPLEITTEDVVLALELLDGKRSFKSVKKQELYDLVKTFAASLIESVEEETPTATAKTNSEEEFIISEDLAMRVVARFEYLEEYVDDLEEAVQLQESDLENIEDTIGSMSERNKVQTEQLLFRLDKLEMFHRKFFEETSDNIEAQDIKLDYLRNEVHRLNGIVSLKAKYSKIPGRDYKQTKVHDTFKKYAHKGLPLETRFTQGQRHMDTPDPNSDRPMKFEASSLFGQREEWENNYNDPDYVYNEEEYMDD